MTSATYTFANLDTAQRVLSLVRQMSGVWVDQTEHGFTATIMPPFADDRLDNVSTVVRGLDPDVSYDAR